MAGRNRSTTRSQLRVIGGAWRGSKLEIGNNPALRPTPERVRETLFNWLAGSVQNARCLDLFAGSGALGIEALSRGAATCDFVESDRDTAKLLDQQLQKLGAGTRSKLLTIDALNLPAPEQAWDIVFIDPPFAAALVPQMVARLAASGYLAADGEIYVETASDDPALDNGLEGFEVWRDKQAGDVRYGLLRRA